MRLVLDSNGPLSGGSTSLVPTQLLCIGMVYVEVSYDLIAPDVFPCEVGNALTRAERKGLLKPPEASEALRDILLVAPIFHESIRLLKRAMEISSETRSNLYDCLYLALAEREDCPLLTADEKFRNAIGEKYKHHVDLL